MREQAEILEHHADAATEARQARAAELHDILAEQPDAAARRTLGQIEHLEQRRLARTGRAGEEIKSPLREAEAQVRQRLGAGAVSQADILELHDAGHSFALRLSIDGHRRPLSHKADGRSKRGGACQWRGLRPRPVESSDTA
jgi:hypothetical protein